MTWDELGEVFNRELRDEDEYYHSSAYRKPYQQAKNYYEDVFSKMTSTQYADEIQELKRELEKEKKKIQTEKLEYNRWLREEARDELILEKVTEAISKLEPLAVPECQVKNTDLETGREWVLAFGDAHFGTEFDIRGVHGETINSYSPEIYMRRMSTLFGRLTSFIAKEHIGKLYIFDLGDCIDGILRMSQLMTLRYGVVESAVIYADYLAQWLNTLSKYCHIEFRMCEGNHDQLRLLDGKKGSFQNENMVKVIYYIIKLRTLDNPNINISDNPTGKIYEEIAGVHIMADHGDEKTSNLERTLKDFSQMYGVPIDILITGHLHHHYSETVGIGTDVMRIPSLIGVDDYSMKLHKTSDPGAILFAVDKGLGKTIEYHINLNDRALY